MLARPLVPDILTHLEIPRNIIRSQLYFIVAHRLLILNLTQLPRRCRIHRFPNLVINRSAQIGSTCSTFPIQKRFDLIASKYIWSLTIPNHVRPGHHSRLKLLNLIVVHVYLLKLIIHCQHFIFGISVLQRMYFIQLLLERSFNFVSWFVVGQLD